MRKLINDQDEEIDGKIDRRGWRIAHLPLSPF
jgi:hypothetical protein